MSHNYKNYHQRDKEIDKNHKKIIKKLENADFENTFFQSSIMNQYESHDQMSDAINYYIRKTTKVQSNLFYMEEILLFLGAYCKIISQNTMQSIFSDNSVATKYIDALNRLAKKELIEKTKYRDENGNSFYALTNEGWERYKQLVNYNLSLYPASDNNFNTTGFSFHDSGVGMTYIRLSLLKKPFLFIRHYYYIRNSGDEVKPDSIFVIFPSSNNRRFFFHEADTGSEGNSEIIDKIGRYSLNNMCIGRKNNYIMFTFEKKNKTFYKDFFLTLFNGGAQQILIVEKLLSHYKCSLDELINILENRNKKSEETGNEEIPIINEEIYRSVTGDKVGKFIEYKEIKSLLCAKSIRLLLSFKWLNNIIPVSAMESDSQKVQLLCEYFNNHKNSNGIQYYLDCIKNIFDTKTRKYSVAKSILRRFSDLNGTLNIKQALSCFYEGAETLFLPNSICDAYLQSCTKQEYDFLYQKLVKKRLEAEYGCPLRYSPLCKKPYKISDFYISDLKMRNCYQFFDDRHYRIEIYVEDISRSLSAIIRVVTLVTELLTISLKGRHCSVICLVDNEVEIEFFNKLLLYVNKKYNNSKRFKVPIYYLLYDGISEGKLLDCKSYKLYDE